MPELFVLEKKKFEIFDFFEISDLEIELLELHSYEGRRELCTEAREHSVLRALQQEPGALRCCRRSAWGMGRGCPAKRLLPHRYPAG